jgi:hypothetical protein
MDGHVARTVKYRRRRDKVEKAAEDFLCYRHSSPCKRVSSPHNVLVINMSKHTAQDATVAILSSAIRFNRRGSGAAHLAA